MLLQTRMQAVAVRALNAALQLVDREFSSIHLPDCLPHRPGCRQPTQRTQSSILIWRWTQHDEFRQA
ncbi:hypothetical protein AK812_SmicGene21928 [Symbiodinium microadriaticum]|uniref:Uncharacterized protein n=1 Tax=Symbiodinium microadriaticum TaxID=2951 RepID=A0A1Q9DL36_SYMMI|nr:hypothetical protein AK812_SmicGene21928 [Symbiodinium microadriaticum]